MYTFIIRRFLQMLIVLLLVSIAVFSLVFFIPGDVTLAILGDYAAKEDVIMLREKLGLDRPIYVQYLIWLRNLVRGDMGRSLTSKYPVAALIRQRLPNTIQLALCGMFLAVLIGLPLGVLSAKMHNTFIDMILRAFSTLGMAMPNFWLGILLILLFSLQLGWLPSSGIVPMSTSFGGWAKSMILPSITIGTRFATVVLRQTRSSMLEVLGTDYVRTARAKGVSELAVTGKHALRNALIPVVTVIGLQTGRLLGGAVVTETIFSLPGLGSLIALAVTQRDFAVVQSGIMIAALGVLGINLIVDIIYGFLDPRIRYR
jgi:peptide/nickel transport system permease protein